MKHVYPPLDYDVYCRNVQLFVAPSENPDDDTVRDQICSRLNFFKHSGLTRYDFVHAWVRTLYSPVLLSGLIISN